VLQCVVLSCVAVCWVGVFYSLLQCVATQCVVVCCSVLSCVAVCCSVRPKHTDCSVLQCVVLQCVVVYCSVLSWRTSDKVCVYHTHTHTYTHSHTYTHTHTHTLIKSCQRNIAVPHTHTLSLSLSHTHTHTHAHNPPHAPGLVNKMLQYYEFQFSKVRHSSSQVQLTRTLQIKVANKKFRHFVDRNIERGQVCVSNMYAYMCGGVCVYIFIIYTHTFIYMCTCKSWIRNSTTLSTAIWIVDSVCMYICIYVWVCVCVYMHILGACVCIYVYTRTHMDM